MFTFRDATHRGLLYLPAAGLRVFRKSAMRAGRACDVFRGRPPVSNDVNNPSTTLHNSKTYKFNLLENSCYLNTKGKGKVIDIKGLRLRALDLGAPLLGNPNRNTLFIYVSELVTPAFQLCIR